MDGGSFGGNTDQIDCETALPVFVSRYVVNGGCFKLETDQSNCESALQVLVHSQSRLLWS